jgi:low temperature requirement protein LtrA
MVVGGPSLYLVGENLFRLRMTGTTSAKRFGAAAALVALALLGSHVSALVTSATVALLLVALVIWELERPSAAPPLPG